MPKASATVAGCTQPGVARPFASRRSTGSHHAVTALPSLLLLLCCCAVGADLNRDFPSPLMAPGCKGQAPEACDPSLLSLAANIRVQPETAAIMAWSSNENFPFTAAANLHEGAVVTNYPWDGYLDGSRDSRGIDNPTTGEAVRYGLVTGLLWL